MRLDHTCLVSLPKLTRQRSLSAATQQSDGKAGEGAAFSPLLSLVHWPIQLRRF